jgi:hypothetical protein
MPSIRINATVAVLALAAGATRDLGELVREAGDCTVSANWQVHDPAQGTVVDPDRYLRQGPA